VAFGTKDSFTLIQQAGLGSIDQVRVSGGGARSSLWRQIMADVLGVELVTVNTTEGAAYGAALLAAVGVGLYASVEEATQTAIQITGRTTPGENTAIYPAVHQLYRGLYPALTGTFQGLTRFVEA
jgi:xylulokinase